ncbi:MAG: hypothetical protein VB078_12035 [Clostridiaceae bacterium]|nr:hypothetical protein [Clostridiaceae bacterium]
MSEHSKKVALIKRLVIGEETICPNCNKAVLEHFHKKAKKSNTDYVCPNCAKRFQVIRMMKELAK